MRAIPRGRTAARGGHVQACDPCGHRESADTSCRDRPCPKGQRLAGARWLEAQPAHRWPTEYPQAVCTLPDVLHPLCLGPPRPGYRLLFAAVAATVGEVARRPQPLGARIGFSAVLHPWTPTRLYPPHVHGLVTGGGLRPDGPRGVAAHPGVLFPVRILGRVCRGQRLRKLAPALAEGPLRTAAADPAALLRQAAHRSWVVYSQPPCAGPEPVLRSLARSTHRLAIATARRVSLPAGPVTCQGTDRAHGNGRKRMPLEAVACLRRFRLPGLPRGLVRIRHSGRLANGAKRKLLPRCRELLGGGPADAARARERAREPEPWPALVARLTGRDPPRCPACRTGPLIVIESGPPLGPLAGARAPARAP